VTLRVVGGDEKGSLKSETVKYGTRTRQRLRWQRPAAYAKDRPVLSSEWAPHKNDRNCQTVINIWSWAVSRNATLTLTLRSVSCCEMSRIESSSGDGSRRWLRRNGKQGIRMWQKYFMCDLKLLVQWDCYKSVARIRLVKTENPSACVTVNCKLWK
jgi:hypothetical protein